MNNENYTKYVERIGNFLFNEMNRIKDSLTLSNKNFLDDIENKERQRSSFINSYRRIPLGCESFFVVLRKWNSYTPSLPVNNEKHNYSQYSIGGGYFLYIQGEENALDPGYGLVIDPGYNFIHNFGQAGFCLDDIDGILITHAHNDHTNDFESLLSLLYQRNKKFKGRKIPKKIDLFLNVGSFKKFSNYLDLTKKSSEDYLRKVIVMSPEQVYKVPDRKLNFEILTLKTNHHEIVTADYSLGICFKVCGRNLLLTGDTGWNFRTSNENEEFLKQFDIYPRTEIESDGQNIDIMVPHIGSIKRYEFDINNDGSNLAQCYYDNHLGILGIISLVEKWKPKLCVISEFGEELVELREKLTEQIEETCIKLYPSIKCVPGDVGLFIFLDSKRSLCYVQEQLIKWDEITFTDIEDNLGQPSIKYYKNGILNNMAKPEEYLKTIKIEDGLSHYKKIYFNDVVNSFNLGMSTEDELIKGLSTIQYDYTDPDQYATAKMEMIGVLFALSCIISDPLVLLNPTLAECHMKDLILDFFKTYYLDTIKFEKFLQKCGRLGIIGPEENHPEEDALYKANRELIIEFLEAFKKNDEIACDQAIDLIGEK